MTNLMKKEGERQGGKGRRGYEEGEMESKVEMFMMAALRSLALKLCDFPWCPRMPRTAVQG